MNKSDIIKKLHIFLDEHPILKEECEAVYLLSEIRKIIEKNKGKYKTLYIYCCWALHSKLSYENIDDFLSEKFDEYINLQKDNGEIQEDLKNGQKEFFKLNDLNQEFNKFLKCHNLPVGFLKGNKWYRFCELFLENIRECQIDLRGLKKKKSEIDRLSVEKVASKYYYLFYLSNGKRIPKIGLTYRRKQYPKI